MSSEDSKKEEAVGSSNSWERATKLLGSALKMVVEGSRTVDAWADHLQGFVFGIVFTALVDYASTRWQSINKALYAYVDDGLTVKDFPIRSTGIGMVTYEYMTFDHEPTMQEVLDKIDRRSNVRRPDRAESESFLEKNPEERKRAPVIALCGSLTNRVGHRGVAFIDASADGVYLYWDWFANRWSQDCRFLVVRK